MQILFQSNEENPRFMFTLVHLQFWNLPREENLFFSTNFCLPIPQDLAYTVAFLKSLWKQILEVERKFMVQPQTQFENSLFRLTSLYFIPSQEEEASYL